MKGSWPPLTARNFSSRSFCPACGPPAVPSLYTHPVTRPAGSVSTRVSRLPHLLLQVAPSLLPGLSDSPCPRQGSPPGSLSSIWPRPSSMQNPTAPTPRPSQSGPCYTPPPATSAPSLVSAACPAWHAPVQPSRLGGHTPPRGGPHKTPGTSLCWGEHTAQFTGLYPQTSRPEGKLKRGLNKFMNNDPGSESQLLIDGDLGGHSYKGFQPFVSLSYSTPDCRSPPQAILGLCGHPFQISVCPLAFRVYFPRPILGEGGRWPSRVPGWAVTASPRLSTRGRCEPAHR